MNFIDTFNEANESGMTTKIGKRTFNVTKTGDKYYYYSVAAGRKLPVAKSKVIFSESIKKGSSVTFTNQDGDDVKAKVVSYDSKKKLYVISVNGNEQEAEPEEIK